MKKTLLISILIYTIVISASAQRLATRNKIAVGVQGGVNFFTITGKTFSGDNINGDLKTGFNAGISVSVPVGNLFSLQPGVEIVQKGTESETGDVKTSLNYIDVPVNLVYQPALGNGKLIVGAGPYVGFGIGGKRTYSGSGGNFSTEYDVEFVNDYTNPITPQFKRVDAGANFLTGYEFANKLSFVLKAQLGLKNVQPNSGSGNGKAKWNNTGFGLSVGYRFK